MKKSLAIFLAAIMALAIVSSASAEGVQLRTTSTFYGADASGQAYMDLLDDWQNDTGNVVVESSAESNEPWKEGVLNDFAAGNEPDVLFFFAGSGDSAPILDKVVPISEINYTYPDLYLPEDELLREPDGNVYAVPVRSFWEGLFCNVDLFEQYDLELPTDFEKLETAIAVFNENGIVPIAIALSDIPNYLVEHAILASGSVEDHRARPLTADEIPDSWVKGMELIAYLYELGAFPENVNTTSEKLTTDMFDKKTAAMLIDGSWRANSLPEENWTTTAVIPFPAYTEDAEATAIVGGTSMGFYLTRKVWEDEDRRDAAVSLLAKLTSDEAKDVLGYSYGGELLHSVQTMLDTASAAGTMCSPIQDSMDPEARKYWFSQIPAIADGTADAREVLAEVINMGAFNAEP